ncbi:MAG: hypothetical protein JWN39_2969, partial [Ilumatobacteraceae bacterium]|nr:hypothetical protein [Ilumatobacteraceae bacterium]
LPLDYGRNLTIVLVLVWLVAIVTIVRRRRSIAQPGVALSSVAAMELLEGTDEEIDHLTGGSGEVLVAEVPDELDGAPHLGEVLEAVGAAGEVPVDRPDEPARERSLEVVADELGPLLTDDDSATEPHDSPSN